MASSRLLLLCVSVVLATAVAAEARDFVVGGANEAWKAPAQSDALAKWASVNRFHVGDKLVFKIDGAADSVLEVTRDDYNRCSTASPLAVHKANTGVGGAATVPLPRSGPYYFVGGAPGSCQKGERLVVVVMSEKHGGRGGRLVPAPAPAPESPQLAASFVGGPAAAPAPAPATGAAGRNAGAGALLVSAAAVLAELLLGC